MSAAFFNYLCG